MCMPKVNQAPQRKQVSAATQSLIHQLLWAVFLILAPVGYAFMPELEDPSLGITIAAWCQLLAACIYWVVPRNGVRGDSPDFCLLLIVALCLRLSMTCKYQGYLPGDITGDGPYQLMEIFTVLAALRGLVRTGLKPKHVVVVSVFLVMSSVAGYQCYGNMNRRAFADRIYAMSIFTEVCAWFSLARSIIMSGNKKRDVFASFLVPMIVQAACRAHFWYLAYDEIIPPKPIQFMDKFPAVLIATHVIMGVLATLCGLFLCTYGRAETPKTTPQQVQQVMAPQQVAMTNPLLAAPVMAPSSTVVPSIAGLPSLPAPAGSGCKCFAPVAATYVNGVLQVQYNPVY